MKENQKTAKVWVGIQGEVLRPEEINVLTSCDRISGIIFFKRNVKNKQQLKILVQSIKTIRSDLLIGIDQEGGPVQRLRPPEFENLSSSREIGALFDASPERGLKAAKNRGELIGRELKNLGIDLNFSPVVDLANRTSLVLKDRTYHENFDVVSALAEAEIEGMCSENIIPVLKHFPGHGGIVADTHIESHAEDFRNYEEIKNKDLKPFEYLIKKNKVEYIMASWVTYPKIDPHPVGYSEYWIEKILRKILEFKGKIFSDDLGMKAAGENEKLEYKLNRLALAGCDIGLNCNDFSWVADPKVI